MTARRTTTQTVPVTDEMDADARREHAGRQPDHARARRADRALHPAGARRGRRGGALRRDRGALRVHLLEAGFGAAPLGADLARPVERVNPGARYLVSRQVDGSP